MQGSGQTCPLCEAGIRSYYVGMLTVVDLSSWTDNKGKVHKNELRVLAAKTDALKLLKLKKDKNNGLAGKRFSVARTGEKSPGCGDVFDLESATVDYPALGFLQGPPKPFDYATLFKPMSVEAMKMVARRILPAPTDSGPSAPEEKEVTY